MLSKQIFLLIILLLASRCLVLGRLVGRGLAIAHSATTLLAAAAWCGFLATVGDDQLAVPHHRPPPPILKITYDGHDEDTAAPSIRGRPEQAVGPQ